MKDLEKLHEKMSKSIIQITDSKTVGIAFSGGVDSSVLAQLCTKLGYKITLLTIGFENSHDIQFSQKLARHFGCKHKIEKISSKNFPLITKKISNRVKSKNLSWIENCIAFYFISKLAKRNKISTVLTANGIDELFCGYNAYREAIKESNQSVVKMMKSKIGNELNMMKEVNHLSSEFGVKILQPFLSKEFILFAKKLPVKSKIRGSNDLMRKHIVRKLALKIGVPEESALKRKKAMQYGSLIHKTLMKIKKI